MALATPPDGGSLSVDTAVGMDIGAGATLTVNTADDDFDVGGTVQAKNASNGTSASQGGTFTAFTIDNGADAESGGTISAQTITTDNYPIDCSGDGSTITVNGALIIGDTGTSQFSTISNGGALNALGGLVLGAQSSGYGVLQIGIAGQSTLGDSGTKLSTGSNVIIADAGTGYLYVANGATFDASNSNITIGNQQGSKGVLDVGRNNGFDGSKFVAVPQLNNGNAGSVALDVGGQSAA